jgi:hypothetical protein
MIAYAMMLVLAADGSAADKTAKAKELYQAGQALYKQGRFAEAVTKFEEANTVKPHPTLPFNIAKCYEQLNDTPRALRAYRDYLRLAPDAKDRAAVSDSIANLERRLRERGLQQLLIFSDPPAAKIAVDGKDLGSSPASVELTAGSHTLTVKAEGFETSERTFTFSIGRATEMTVNLKPGSTPPLEAKKPPLADAPVRDTPRGDATVATGDSNTLISAPPLPLPEKKGRVWTYVAGGVAVAGLGAGIALGVVANGTAASLTKSATPQPNRASADAIVTSARGQALGADISYGVAGAAAVVAVVLFFVEGH